MSVIAENIKLTSFKSAFITSRDYLDLSVNCRVQLLTVLPQSPKQMTEELPASQADGRQQTLVHFLTGYMAFYKHSSHFQ